MEGGPAEAGQPLTPEEWVTMPGATDDHDTGDDGSA